MTQRKPGDILWFNEHDGPNRTRFSPDHVVNDEASEAALLPVGCQNGGHDFHVAKTEREARSAFLGPPTTVRIAIERNTLHFGDPPYGCCDTGAFTNTVPVRVLEYWRRGSSHDGNWVRDRAFERKIVVDWA